MEGQQQNTAQKTNFFESDASLTEVMECPSLSSNVTMDTNSKQCMYNQVCSIDLYQDGIYNNLNTENYGKDSPQNVKKMPVPANKQKLLTKDMFNASILSADMFGDGLMYETEYSKTEVEDGRTESESSLQSASESSNKQIVNSQNCIPAPQVPLSNQCYGTDMHSFNVCSSSHDSPLTEQAMEPQQNQNFMLVPQLGMFPYIMTPAYDQVSSQYNMMPTCNNFPPAQYKLVSVPVNVPTENSNMPQPSHNVPSTHYVQYWFPLSQLPCIPNANIHPCYYNTSPYVYYDHGLDQGKSTQPMRTNSETESQYSKESAKNVKETVYLTPELQSQNSEEDVKNEYEVNVDITARSDITSTDDFRLSATSQSEPIYDEILPQTFHENLHIFQDSDAEKCSDIDQGVSQQSIPVKGRASLPISSNKQSFNITNKIKIEILVGSLSAQNVDVIVDSTNHSFDLNVGMVSKNLLDVGGEALQNECRSKYPNGITAGQIAFTSGHNLPCKEVFHGVIPKWNQGQGNSKQIMVQFINDCLATADTHKFNSIAFPALGTGALGFPAYLVADIFFSITRIYEWNNPGTNLQLVCLVLRKGDEAVIKAFRDAESRPVGVIVFAHQPSTQANGDNYMIGHVRLTVCQDDITKENTDVIVNSTTKDFKLASGMVSSAILKAAGTKIQTECNEQFKKGTKMLVTSAGKLQCQKIIHLSARNSVSNWEKSILACLDKVENMEFSSISFPALGTGGKGITPEDIAKKFVSAILKYTTSIQCQNILKTVRIVIYDTKIFGTFTKSIKAALHKEMSNKNAVTVQYLLRRPRDKENVATQICLDSTKCVSDVVKKPD